MRCRTARSSSTAGARDATPRRRPAQRCPRPDATSRRCSAAGSTGCVKGTRWWEHNHVDASRRALNRLRDAYAAGVVSTDTLEVRTGRLLAGDIVEAVWALPRRWFPHAPEIRVGVCI